MPLYDTESPSSQDFCTWRKTKFCFIDGIWHRPNLYGTSDLKSATQKCHTKLTHVPASLDPSSPTRLPRSPGPGSLACLPGFPDPSYRPIYRAPRTPAPLPVFHAPMDRAPWLVCWAPLTTATDQSAGLPGPQPP